jgi:peptidoglycan/xylan/chitin deacetylase (PgdA/CDA1 family)
LWLLAPLLLASSQTPYESDSSSAIPLPLVRSIVCPVLYTHEVQSQATMRRFLSGLLAAGYRPTSLQQVDGAMTGAAERPPGCVVLSFDDALMSQYVNALPVLQDMGQPAVFFVLPGFNDGVHRYMGIAELQALAQAGFEVEAHTCNHPNLPALARRNMNAFYAELQECRKVLEAIVGRPVDYIAYPSGSYDPVVLDAVARLGFRAAFTTRPTVLLTANSPYTLPRIRYDAAEAPTSVVARIRSAGG